jgi:phosphohistidine phosphatase
MRIYLIRHGEAMEDLQDSRRPLSAEGRRQVERVASQARVSDAAPRHIFHSGKLRALETAEIVGAALCPAGVDIRAVAGLAPDDDPTAAAELAALAEEDLLFAGHLPHLSLLAGLLTGRSISFSTATMVCLERSDAGTKPTWTIQWIAAP